MAKTGFYDSDQGIYLPKDSLTWADLTSGWNAYTTWYQNLSSSTTVEFTTDIHDFGSSKSVVPLLDLTLGVDGDRDAAASLISGKPAVTIEGSDNATLSSGVTTVNIDKDTNYDVTTVMASMGAKRYYRTTININSGINTRPQGIRGFSIEFVSGDGDTRGYIVSGVPSVSMDETGNILRDET